MAASLAGLAASIPEVSGVAEALTGTDVTVALSSVVFAALALVSAWLCLVTTAVILGRWLPSAARLAPRWVATALTCGAVSATALSLSAQASPTGLDGLQLPDRVGTQAAVEPTTTVTDVPAQQITVRSGDCLWSLAATTLGTGATPGDIAEAVSAWHQTNRDVIGPDPDLIHPGQVLTVPTADLS